VNAELWKDFCTFAKAHISSGDIDPTYPVLRRVYEAEKCTPEQAIWRTILFLTWYHVGSAVQVWQRFPDPVLLPDIRLPTGTERRGFRGNDLAHRTVNEFVRMALVDHGSFKSWLWFLTHAGGTAGWDEVRDAVEKVPHCGPWASYKFADLCAHVLGFAITASDIGVGGGSATAGPIPGMVALTGQPWKECVVNRKLQRDLLAQAISDGVPFTGLDQLETSLCDFNSMLQGHYYVGHDIDDQMAKLVEAPRVFWEARQKVFQVQYLGELCGWFGVRKKLKTAYSDRKELIL
jgi:hypothetical protein